MRRLLLIALGLFISNVSAAQESGPRSRFASFDGVKIHYNSIGAGRQALLFIHGWTCSAEFWKLSVDQFPEYHVISIDLPGHGRSDKPYVDYTFDYFAKSIESVLVDSGVEKAVLVGHSMGASVAERFYRQHPTQTLGLILVDGLPWIEALSQEAAAPLPLQKLIEGFRSDYHQSAITQIDRMVQPIADSTLKNYIRSTMISTPAYVGLSAAESIVDELQKRRAGTPLQQIDVPVVAILSAEGPWKPNTDSFIKSIAHKSELYNLIGVSHFLMLEKPSTFNKIVRTFMLRNHLLQGIRELSDPTIKSSGLHDSP